jgi:MFS transporter, YQGE family, putative transporter
MGLPRELLRLLIMNAVSFIIFIYIGIFVNLFIWEQGHRIFDVTWFNLSMFFTWGFAFSFGAGLLKKWSVRLLFGISAGFGGTAFLLLSLLKLDNRLLWIALIGIPVGAMWGFFAVAQNLCVSLLGKGKDFGNFFAASTTVSQILNMSVPLLSAQVIHGFGYTGSFGLMLVFVIGMLVMSRFVPEVSLRDQNPIPDPWYASLNWRSVFPSSGLKWLIPSCLAGAFIIQFQNLFGLLFTFTVTENKTIIALLNMLYTCSSLLALFMYRRYRMSEFRWFVLGLGLLAAGFLLVLYPAKPLLIVSNVLMTMGLFYFSTNWNGQQFRMIAVMTPAEQARLLVWRECLLSLTRCFMLLLILQIEDFHGPAFLMMIAMALFSLLAVAFSQRKAGRELRPAKEIPAAEA